MSHLGRPKNGAEDKFSLKYIIRNFEKLVGTKVSFANDCIGREAKQKSASLKSGEILLLENVRFHSEETMGDITFSK